MSTSPLQSSNAWTWALNKKISFSMLPSVATQSQRQNRRQAILTKIGSKQDKSVALIMVAMPSLSRNVLTLMSTTATTSRIKMIVMCTITLTSTIQPPGACKRLVENKLRRPLSNAVSNSGKKSRKRKFIAHFLLRLQASSNIDSNFTTASKS